MTKEKNIIIPGAAGKPIALDIFYNPAQHQPLVIYAHGFNGFKDWGNFDLVAEEFAKAGFCFVKFNFSHNGTTPKQPEDFADLEAYGNNNYTKELDDLQPVINWLVNEDHVYSTAIDKTKICLLGHSRGGGVVLLTATEDLRIKAITTWASVAKCRTPWETWPKERLENWQRTGVEYYTNTRTKQQMPLYYQLYEDYQTNKERLDILNAVSRLKIALLICHGNNDETVPVEKAWQIQQAAVNAEVFLVISDHVFGRKHPWPHTVLPSPMEDVVIKTISFFKNQLSH